MRQKVYIAGRITGVKDYKERFAEERRIWEEKGWAVLDPSVLPEGMMPADYMRICLAMIDTADVVVMMKGWRLSGGARVEYNYCRYTGKKAVEYDGFVDDYRAVELHPVPRTDIWGDI